MERSCCRKQGLVYEPRKTWTIFAFLSFEKCWAFNLKENVDFSYFTEFPSLFLIFMLLHLAYDNMRY